MSKLGDILSNPETSEKIRSIVDSIPSPDEHASVPVAVQTTDVVPSSSPQFPLAALMKGGGGAGVPKTIKNGRALLAALKPYLDSERREKIDKILEAMKLAEFAGIFKTML